MLPKLNICEKKRENNFGKLVTTKALVFAKGKKANPFFLRDLCQIYFVHETKRTFLKTSSSKRKC